MSIWEALALLGAGLAAGGINAIAGGGSLISFPILVGIGLPGVAANVTNALSVAPGYFASALSSRPELTGQRPRILRIIPTVVAGTLGGSALLLLTPREAFDYVVPFLVLGATAMMAFQTKLRGLTGHPERHTPRKAALLLHLTVFLCGLYGGYFNAALGVLLIAGLSLVLDESIKRIGALKNVLSAVVGSTTVLIYSIFGPVNWAAVAVLVPATVVGGVLGARLARRLPAALLRRLIIGFGAVVGVVLLVEAFS
ncbi:sulfite exporter TauE/SafE family protein [Actinoplanes sp. RD1]|uniref:sulfite exporter TauE/SafE family protein n=1 Tax=Actinoplanes sp. RD1 TaxID=3064538 RepID=UPI002741E74B|nr:sulfite exporter TauE/SafE family protein [Actinoplanes sp. RD1]